MMTFKEFLIENDYKNLTLDILSRYLEKRHGATVDLFSHGNDIHVLNVIVPKHKRKQGIGTSIMRTINGYADAHGKRVLLNVADKDDYHGTTSRNRLLRFYKGLGYIHNKGRKKDFTISSHMYRNPKTTLTQ